jgi:hypothetical protein
MMAKGWQLKAILENLSKINIPAVVDGIPVREIEGNGWEQPALPWGLLPSSFLLELQKLDIMLLTGDLHLYQ